MDFSLKRVEFRKDGIFSELYDADGNLVAHTLEHSYDNLPKVPNGQFTCVRGQHQLHGMAKPFSTFEITGVVGHTGILFHMGNWNADSDGCVLVGEGIAQSSKGQMITNSVATFNAFIAMNEGVDSFTLTVE